MDISRKDLQDLIIMRSARIHTHPIIPFGLEKPSQVFLENCKYLSVDGKLLLNYVVCNRCENVFTNNSSNRRFIVHHILSKHTSEVEMPVTQQPGNQAAQAFPNPSSENETGPLPQEAQVSKGKPQSRNRTIKKMN